MIRKIIIACLVFVVLYALFVKLQIFATHHFHKNPEAMSGKDEVTHKVYAFSFSKYTPTGEKEIEIEGDSANLLAQTVDLMNVVAKAYAEETPVTITADTGNYDKSENRVNLKKNVVATTENGTRLMSEELQILPSQHVMSTEAQARVKKDNINIDGLGAVGDSGLKKVKFKKNVTVVVQDPKDTAHGPTVITCDGPLVIDYEKNVAHFKKNVQAQDSRGKLTSDVMDVFYNKVSRKVSKIVAIGNVVIENPDGNKTYSDNVIYFADEGRIILGGDAEALYFDQENSSEDSDVPSGNKAA